MPLSRKKQQLVETHKQRMLQHIRERHGEEDRFQRQLLSRRDEISRQEFRLKFMQDLVKPLASFQEHILLPRIIPTSSSPRSIDLLEQQLYLSDMCRRAKPNDNYFLYGHPIENGSIDFENTNYNENMFQKVSKFIESVVDRHEPIAPVDFDDIKNNYAIPTIHYLSDIFLPSFGVYSDAFGS